MQKLRARTDVFFFSTGTKLKFHGVSPWNQHVAEKSVKNWFSIETDNHKMPMQTTVQYMKIWYDAIHICQEQYRC